MEFFCNSSKVVETRLSVAVHCASMFVNAFVEIPPNPIFIIHLSYTLFQSSHSLLTATTSSHLFYKLTIDSCPQHSALSLSLSHRLLTTIILPPPSHITNRLLPNLLINLGSNPIILLGSNILSHFSIGGIST